MEKPNGDRIKIEETIEGKRMSCKRGCERDDVKLNERKNDEKAKENEVRIN